MKRPVILCIDDDPVTLKGLALCLESENCEILQVKGGEEGLQLLEARDGAIDLLIVDQRMPGMMGDEFLKKAQDKFGPLKAIMISAFSDFEALVRALNDGRISHFVPKPWSNAQLLDVVRKTLASST